MMFFAMSFASMALAMEPGRPGTSNSSHKFAYGDRDFTVAPEYIMTVDRGYLRDYGRFPIRVLSRTSVNKGKQEHQDENGVPGTHTYWYKYESREPKYYKPSDDDYIFKLTVGQSVMRCQKRQKIKQRQVIFNDFKSVKGTGGYIIVDEWETKLSGSTSQYSTEKFGCYTLSDLASKNRKTTGLKNWIEKDGLKHLYLYFPMSRNFNELCRDCLKHHGHFKKYLKGIKDTIWTFVSNRSKAFERLERTRRILEEEALKAASQTTKNASKESNGSTNSDEVSVTAEDLDLWTAGSPVSDGSHTAEEVHPEFAAEQKAASEEKEPTGSMAAVEAEDDHPSTDTDKVNANATGTDKLIIKDNATAVTSSSAISDIVKDMNISFDQRSRRDSIDSNDTIRKRIDMGFKLEDLPSFPRQDE